MILKSMSKVLRFVSTCLGYFMILVAMGICIIPCIIIACLPASWRFRSRLYYILSSFFYRISLWATFTRCVVVAQENVPSGPVIFAANHQSSLDIPMLGSLVGTDRHVWMYLAKFTKIPLFGFILSRMNVAVDSSGLKRVVGSLDKALELIERYQSHLMIFPEGGRYIDGQIHNFFYGLAVIARRSGRPIVPVLLVNPGKAYPPGAFFFRLYPLKIIVGKPMYYQSGDNEADFLQRVHQWFLTTNAGEQA